MIDEIKGKTSGCSGGFGGSMHLIDEDVGFMGSTAIVGGTIPIGVGLGLSFKLKMEDRISCIFFGDAAIEEGAFYESANFAALHKLPVLFICENNGMSVYSPLSVRQPPNRRIFQLARAIGLTSSRGVSNVWDANERALSAVNRIRSGNGPEFIEFNTKREHEHCGPGMA